jgi:hypothetical protein
MIPRRYFAAILITLSLFSFWMQRGHLVQIVEPGKPGATANQLIKLAFYPFLPGL